MQQARHASNRVDRRTFSSSLHETASTRRWRPILTRSRDPAKAAVQVVSIAGAAEGSA